MPEASQGIILQDDILVLTPKGNKELQSSGTALSPAEIEMLVLVDGASTAGETIARAAALGKTDGERIFAKLYQEGLIEVSKDRVASLDFVDFFQSQTPLSPSAEAVAQAKKQVAATTALLQQKGYSVRIARKAGSQKDADKSRALTAIVIEDEPHLAAMLKHVLSREGFDVRIAGDRAQVVAEMRRPPRPDLILLDIVLPDTDGFEILLRIRQHPLLKALPVVMLTAQATRESVLKGLESGADGYITKPFQINVLLKAVRSVLGLPGGADDDSEDPWESA